MNELQIVLILLAIMVVVGLYFFQNKKEKAEQQTREDNKTTKARSEADTALNDLGNAHIPVSDYSAPTILDEEAHNQNYRSAIPESQLGFSFDNDLSESVAENSKTNIEETAQKRKPKHVILEVEDIQEIAGFNQSPVADVEIKTKQPAFGIPKEKLTVETSTNGDIKEPQLFAIIVKGSEEFLMSKINQTLHGVGLTLSDKDIFVKKDSMGGDIIRVANLLEPGTFSQEQLKDTELTSAGVVLILELPSSVKAPAVMHDMILMARKISQRLNGRLYDMNRQLIKESDLQKMRDQAIAYETQAI